MKAQAQVKWVGISAAQNARKGSGISRREPFRDVTVSRPAQLTVRVNVCMAAPTEFVAVIVRV